jgi:uncharacterized membrane protein YecN with MAPEG domain
MATTHIGLTPQFPLLPITSTYTLPLTIYYISLSTRVCMQRLKSNTIMGDRRHTTSTPEDLLQDPLHTAIRAQSNFLETVPLALIIAAAAELNGASKRALTWALGVLTFLRIVHVEVGLLTPGTRGLGRFAGYWGSVVWMAGVSGWAVWEANGYWRW